MIQFNIFPLGLCPDDFGESLRTVPALRFSRLQGEWLQDSIDSDRRRLQLARNETSSLGQFGRGNAQNV